MIGEMWWILGIGIKQIFNGIDYEVSCLHEAEHLHESNMELKILI